MNGGEARLVAVAVAVQAEEDRIALEREAVPPAMSFARKAAAAFDALVVFDREHPAG